MSFSLPNHTLYDILKFFDRKELHALSFACRRAHRIISNEFQNAPYLLLTGVLHYKGARSYYTTLEQNVPIELLPKQLDLLKTMKFIRLTQSSFDATSLTGVEHNLVPVSHIWHGRKLLVAFREAIPNDFVPKLTSASYLAFTCSSANFNSMLREMLRGRCDALHFVQNATSNATVELTIAEVMDFLFQPVSALGQSAGIKHRSFYMRTRIAPAPQIFGEMCAALEEKFINARENCHFRLLWDHFEDEDMIFVHQLTNPRISQKLRIARSIRGGITANLVSMCSRRSSSYFRSDSEPDQGPQKLQESNYSHVSEEAISDLYKAAMQYWHLVNLPFKVQWTGSIPTLSFPSNSTSTGDSKSKSNSEKKSNKKSSRKKSGLPPPPLDSPRPRFENVNLPCRCNFKPEMPSNVFSSSDISNRVLPQDPLVNLADFRNLALQQPRHRIFGSSDLDEN